MLEYFIGMGGLAIGFIIGMLYSDYKNSKKEKQKFVEAKSIMEQVISSQKVCTSDCNK